MIKLGSSFEGFPLSAIEELRSTISKFKDSKKFVVVFSEMYTLKALFFASVATKIYTHPTSLVVVNGLIGFGQFFKKTLEKLKIEMDGYQREKYKNAYNSFMEEKFTDEHKEAVTSLIDSVNSIFISEIAKGRNVKEEVVKSWIEEGLYTSKKGKEAGIIDGLTFYEDIQDDVKKDFGMKNPNFLFTSVYTTKVGRYYSSRAPTISFKSNTEIAVVHLAGNIVEGESSEGVMGADTVCRIIRLAANSKAKAIIICVNSPGGSAVASETIRHAIVDAQKKGKKIIISMGSVAASGGYWISMNADSIVCNRTTITGSIGVLSLKPNLRKFYSEWLGITFDEYQTSESSTMFSSLHSVKKGSNNDKKFNELCDYFYEDFLTNVSEGRKIEKDKVKELAQGKVYTGEQALKLKLVDRLGGFSEAVDEAITLLKLTEYDTITIQQTEQISLSSLLFKKKPNNSKERTDIGFSFFSSPFSTVMKVFQMIQAPLQRVLFMSESSNQVQATCEIKEL